MGKVERVRTNEELLKHSDQELEEDELKEVSGGHWTLNIGQGESYTCSICGYRAKNADDYNVHFRTKHLGGGTSVGFA